MANAFRVSGRRAGLRFDAEHGVATEALLFLGELDPEAIGPNLEHATHYEPTPVDQFERLIGHVPFSLEGASFVDLGSGMGRVVLLAAGRPFKQVIGIEISPALHEIARDNLASYERANLRCRDVRLIRRDAAQAFFPPGNLVVYLYNPFRAPVLERVVARLVERESGALAVIYHTPLERATFEASAAFELVAEEPFGIVYGRRA
ncbi:MAG: methyltransferase domain-containing protein [Vulcanimicrobiaceae bacterium]